MLSDEQVISIKKSGDCYLKMIELVRSNLANSNKENEMYKVFCDIHKIKKYNEKMLYLLCFYVVNSDDNVLDILIQTSLITNCVIDDCVKNGININELTSTILKEYINDNTNNSDAEIINALYDLSKQDEDIGVYVYSECCVDYNITHLEKENIKRIEDNNKILKRKIRRKILYDKYQGR